MITEQEINSAYTAQKKAAENYFKAAEVALNYKTDYETKVVVALANGEIEGSNEAKRKANAQVMFAKEFVMMTSWEANERKAKLDLDLAVLEVSRVRALLRIAEITAGMVEYSGK